MTRTDHDRTRTQRVLRTRLTCGAGLIATTAMLAGAAADTQVAAAFQTPSYDTTIGGPGSAFVYPFGEAWDPTTYTQGATQYDGTLLVDDYNNYDVKRFAADGTWLATYSSKGNGPGQFSEQPSGIAVDPTNGDFVVSFAFDGFGYMEFAPDGNLLQTVSVAAAWYAPFIAINAGGDVYLVQSTGLEKSQPNVVFMFDSNGNPVGEFGTNGTSCSKGQFGVIRGIDVDGAGNVYVNDVSNHCIQEFTSSGQFIAAFGNKAQLSANTRGISIDRANDVLYVADADKQEVEAYSIAAGSFGAFQGTIGTPGSTVGNSCGGGGELDGPRDAVAGPDGTVYVSDYTCWTIDTYNPLFASSEPGAFVSQFTGPPPPDGLFNMPVGVTVSPIDGEVYVTDSFNQRIQEFNGLETPGGTAGAFVQTWGSRLPTLSAPFALDYPRGVAVDPSTGNLWVSDTRSGYIKEYTTSGTSPGDATVTFDADFGGEGLPPAPGEPAQFFYSDGIAVGPDGTLYIPDSGLGYFEVTNQAGIVESLFPCGALAGQPSVFNGCTTAAFDAANGYVYAASINQGVVDVLNPADPLDPLVTTVGSGTLGQPFGVAISGSTLYVTDSKKDRVSEFTIAAGGSAAYDGSFGSSGSGNGEFTRPLDIAVDSAGNIYVVDYGNDRVEVFTP
jgi:DNA-binding beta-propeller fold protein YncE